MYLYVYVPACRTPRAVSKVRGVRVKYGSLPSPYKLYIQLNTVPAVQCSSVGGNDQRDSQNSSLCGTL